MISWDHKHIKSSLQCVAAPFQKRNSKKPATKSKTPKSSRTDSDMTNTRSATHSCFLSCSYGFLLLRVISFTPLAVTWFFLLFFFVAFFLSLFLFVCFSDIYFFFFFLSFLFMLPFFLLPFLADSFSFHDFLSHTLLPLTYLLFVFNVLCMFSCVYCLNLFHCSLYSYVCCYVFFLLPFLA